jgi:hypothetical protein
MKGYFWPIPVLHEMLIKEFANWRETTQTGSTGFLLKGQESTGLRHPNIGDARSAM